MRTSEVRVDAVENKGGTYNLDAIWPGDKDITLEWDRLSFEYGYMVSVPGGIDNLPFLPDDVIDAVGLTRLINPLTGKQDTGLYLGIWQNPETKLWSIDVSMWIETPMDANMLSVKYNQLAFWDCKCQLEILTTDRLGILVPV